jgi:hypothetical protein
MIGNALEKLHNSPTALLPTMATFLCFGAGGILLSPFGEGREEADRLARFEVWRSQSSAGVAAWDALVLAFSGRS